MSCLCYIFLSALIDLIFLFLPVSSLPSFIPPILFSAECTPGTALMWDSLLLKLPLWIFAYSVMKVTELIKEFVAIIGSSADAI